MIKNVHIYFTAMFQFKISIFDDSLSSPRWYKMVLCLKHLEMPCTNWQKWFNSCDTNFTIYSVFMGHFVSDYSVKWQYCTTSCSRRRGRVFRRWIWRVWRIWLWRLFKALLKEEKFGNPKNLTPCHVAKCWHHLNVKLRQGFC